MIAKIFIALVVCSICFCICDGRAGDHEKYIVSVRATNGLTLGVDVIDAKLGTNSTEVPVGLVFKAPANINESELFMLKNEYIARLELYDSNNHPVAKTKLGSEYGRKFDKAQWGIKEYSNNPHGPTGAKNTWTWGEMLPKTAELFAVNEPGTYRLKLEAQVMVLYLDVAKKETRQIVRFPPVEIMVTRPASVKDNR